MSNTNITTTTDTTTVTVTENVVEIELNNVGVQGIPGLSGVVSVTSPITNVGSAGSAIVGINQALLSITKSQVSDFASGTVTSASTAQQAGTALFATNASTAVFATTSGTATYANAAEQTLYLVRNNTGTTILKGTLLAASGAEPSGRIDVEPFVVTGLQDSELRVMGVATANISNGVNGTVMSFGTLVGVDTRGNFESALAVGDETWAVGDILFAHPTVAGKLTKVRPQHDLAVAFITVRNATAGQIAIRIVPGNFHLEWLHDVSITSPTNNQVLTYDSASSLWVNANNPADGVTSITATAPLTGGTITSTGSIGLDQTALSITRSQVSDFTSGTVASAGTAQQAGTAVYSVNSGTAVYATTSGTAVTISGDITKSQVSDFTSGTVAQADNATTSGTAVYATNSGTAVFATTSGTATYATNSGTAVFATNASTAVSVSGSAITQSQIVNLVSDLAGKANLAGGNAFTGAQTVTGTATGSIVQIIRGASGQANDFFSIQNSGGTALARVNLNGSAFFGQTTGSYPTFFGASGSLAGMINVVPASAAVIPIIIRGAASQSANLQEWQDSAGTLITRIAAQGQLGTTARITVGQTAISTAGQLSVVGNTDRVQMAVVGNGTQTADLQVWQNSASANLARVLADGTFYAQALATNNLNATLSEESAGGRLRLTKATSAMTAPGANLAKIYLRDGTNAGTLKLVVRAGAAGAETTILDNIPQ
jgi:hypothetical protein